MPSTVYDDVYTNPSPQFTGPGWTQTWALSTRADANVFAQQVVTGLYDPFLGIAYDEVQVTQNRDVNGRVLSGWIVIGIFNRPIKGQSYKIVA